jgi:hypothetical protein
MSPALSMIGVILKNIAAEHDLDAVPSALQGLTEREQRKVIRLTWPEGTTECETLFSIMGL